MSKFVSTVSRTTRPKTKRENKPSTTRDCLNWETESIVDRAGRRSNEVRLTCHVIAIAIKISATELAIDQS